MKSSESPCGDSDWLPSKHLVFPSALPDWTEGDQQALAAFYQFLGRSLSHPDIGDCNVSPTGKVAFRIPSQLPPGILPSRLSGDRMIRYLMLWRALRSLGMGKPPDDYAAFEQIRVQETIAATQAAIDRTAWEHVWTRNFLEITSPDSKDTTVESAAASPIPTPENWAEKRQIIERHDLLPVLIGWFSARLITAEGLAALREWYRCQSAGS